MSEHESSLSAWAKGHGPTWVHVRVCRTTVAEAQLSGLRPSVIAGQPLASSSHPTTKDEGCLLRPDPKGPHSASDPDRFPVGPHDDRR